MRAFALFWTVAFVAGSASEVFAAHSHPTQFAESCAEEQSAHAAAGHGAQPVDEAPADRGSHDHSEACTCHLLCGTAGVSMVVPPESRLAWSASDAVAVTTIVQSDTPPVRPTAHLIPFANAPPAPR